jgi:hypothetical protein
VSVVDDEDRTRLREEEVRRAENKLPLEAPLF